MALDSEDAGATYMVEVAGTLFRTVDVLESEFLGTPAGRRTGTTEGMCLFSGWHTSSVGRWVAAQPKTPTPFGMAKSTKSVPDLPLRLSQNGFQRRRENAGGLLPLANHYAPAAQ
eukprot:2306135-Rhodomonas_salina.1